MFLNCVIQMPSNMSPPTRWQAQVTGRYFVGTDPKCNRVRQKPNMPSTVTLLTSIFNNIYVLNPSKSDIINRQIVGCRLDWRSIILFFISTHSVLAIRLGGVDNKFKNNSRPPTFPSYQPLENMKTNICSFIFNTISKQLKKIEKWQGENKHIYAKSKILFHPELDHCFKFLI